MIFVSAVLSLFSPWSIVVFDEALRKLKESPNCCFSRKSYRRVKKRGEKYPSSIQDENKLKKYTLPGGIQN